MELKKISLYKNMTSNDVNKLIGSHLLLQDDIYLGTDYKHTWKCLNCEKETFIRRWRGIRENRIICEKCRSISLSGNDFYNIKLLKGISKEDVNKLIGKWITLEDDMYYGADFNHNWKYVSGKHRCCRWADIKNKANIKVDETGHEYISERSEYNEDELIYTLKEYYKTYNKVPTMKDINEDKNMPNRSAFNIVFGNIRNALIKAELFEFANSSFFAMDISDDDIIKNTKEIIDENLKNNRLITLNDIHLSNVLPKHIRVYNVFNSKDGIKGIYEYLGYNYNELKDYFLKKDLKSNLIVLSEKIKRTPSSRDIDKHCKSKEINSSATYIDAFGGLYEAYIYCGLNPTTQSISLKLSNDDLINMLKDLSLKLNRTPTCLELEEYGIPSRSLFTQRFGGYNKALKIAGLSPTKRVFKSNFGNEFKSMVEVKFANMLESNNIEYNCETFYKDVVLGFSRKYRFDFDIQIENKKIYIEIFGIQNNEFYNNRKMEKIKLCNENNVNLIHFNWYDVNDLSELDLYEKLIEMI